MKNILDTLTGKKYHKFITIFVATTTAFVSFFIVALILSLTAALDKFNNVFVLITVFLGLALIVESLYYFIKFSPLKNSIKLVTVDGNMEHINEIEGQNFGIDMQPMFSEHFFCDLKNNFFIAYQSIIWIYRKDNKIIIRTINGKAFKTSADYDTLHTLLTKNSQILNGYNLTNYQKYKSNISEFNQHIALNAKTMLFAIPALVNNFWKWLSTKVKSKPFYAIGFTCEVLFFIGLIVIANIDTPGKRLPNWIFVIWISVNFIGAFCLWIGFNISAYEPTTNKPAKKKHFTFQKTNSSAPVKKEFIEKTYLHKLFEIKDDAQNTTPTFIALDNRNGKALKVTDHHIIYDNSHKYEICEITYNDVRKFAKQKKLDKLYKTLSSSNWKLFLTEEKSEKIIKKCKYCKKDFPEAELDNNGYCPHCAENWWKS